ncbi:hypothetical protein MFUL124B02_08390 [Myxococcus fulvus 124B02]|nr:hypothetical protein MFUL124B02_08390 [Myxococcus fulvus 124B02]
MPVPILSHTLGDQGRDVPPVRNSLTILDARFAAALARS